MKKKISVIVCVLLLMSVSLFAATEHWVGAGGEYSFSVTPHEKTDSTILHSAGFNIMSYNFFGSKSAVGVYSDLAFLFPFSYQVKDKTADVSDLPMEFSLIIGPAYRHDINKDMAFSAAVGFHFGTQGTSDSLEIWGISILGKGTAIRLGVGIDAGVQFSINNKFFIRTGAKFGFDFGQHISASGKIAGTILQGGQWIDGYFRFSATPYIGGGVYLNTGRRAGLGRL